MNSGTKKRGFWTTLPGILTGLASIITALTGVWFIFYPSSNTREMASPVVYQKTLEDAADPCKSSVSDNWKIIKSHAGEVTDAVVDMTRFLMLAAQYGCTGYTYTLRVNKQNISVFVVTLHEPYPHNGFKYRELATTTEVGGERTHATWLSRSPMDSDNWELVD